MQTPAPTLVLIDGECALCRALGARLERGAPAAVRVCAIESPTGAGALGGLAHAERLRGLHVLGGDGVLRTAGDALPTLLRALGRTRLARLADRFPGPRDRAYAFVARNRHRLRVLGGSRRT